MSEILDRLHRATRRGGYDDRKRAWAAFRAYAAGIVTVLPFEWHATAMDNPTQNHTGMTNGTTHIVLDEPFSRGRLLRATGSALCGGETVNLWNTDDKANVTCKRCLEIAERLTRTDK